MLYKWYMVSGNVGEDSAHWRYGKFGSGYRDKKASLGIRFYRGAEYSIFYMNGVT
jgi:hypothetical protein